MSDENTHSPEVEMLARMWMECDPNRGGSNPDEVAPLHVDGKEQLLPRWHWFVPRAEASLRYFSTRGYQLGVATDPDGRDEFRWTDGLEGSQS